MISFQIIYPGSYSLPCTPPYRKILLSFLPSSLYSIQVRWLSNNYRFHISSLYHYSPVKEKLSKASENYHDNENIFPFAIFDEDNISGIIVVQKIDREAYEIIDIDVDSDYRKQGIASKLIDYIIKKFKIKTLFVETDDDTVGFYGKYGFINSELINKIEDTNRYRCTLTNVWGILI